MQRAAALITLLRALVASLISGRLGSRGRTVCGIILGILLAWEFIARPLLAMWRPEIPLPPSLLDDVIDLAIVTIGDMQ